MAQTREERLAKSRARYLVVRGSELAKAKARRAANPEKYLEMERISRESRRDKIREYGKRIRAERPERLQAATNKWRAKNPGKVQVIAIRRRAKVYGLTVDQYTKMMSRACQICGAQGGKMCIDHDHATGQVRGSLCDNCNRGMGLLGDDAERLLKAAVYLLERKELTPRECVA